MHLGTHSQDIQGLSPMKLSACFRSGFAWQPCIDGLAQRTKGRSQFLVYCAPVVAVVEAGKYTVTIVVVVLVVVVVSVVVVMEVDA